MAKTFVPVSCLSLACLALLASCAKGPAPVQPGTPAFFWGVAHTAYTAADYAKTSETLAQLSSSENDFASRARVWALVVSAGLAQGYADLADAYDNGRKFNRKDPTAFREPIRVAKAAASQNAMVFAETFRKFLDSDKSAAITLAFEFPKAAGEEPPQLARLGKGIAVSGVEAETLQAFMLKRGVMRVAARAVGSANDPAKAADVYKAGSAPRPDFLLAMAGSLYEISALYGPKKLDEPQRLQAFCILAQTALKQVPQSAKTKELQGKITKSMGKGKTS